MYGINFAHFFKFQTQNRLSATNARLRLLSNVVMSEKTLLLFTKENARKINSLFKFALRYFCSETLCK